jgi:hypothetical protein
MVTNLKAAEDFFIAQLQPLIGIHNAYVEAMSSKVFNKVVSTSNIYVSFESAKNADINTFNRGYAKNIVFSVMVQAQDLRTHERGYPIFADIEQALVGKKPIPGGGEIDLLEMRFMTEFVPDGLWIYSMLFGFQIYD